MSSAEGANEHKWKGLVQSLIDELYDLPLERFNEVPPFRATLSSGLHMCSSDELEGRTIEKNDFHDVGEPMEINLKYQRVELEDLSSVHVQRYVGKEWETNFINPLNNVARAETPREFAVEPHPWQLKGAAQIHWLCQSNFRGGICADAPGLGKTILAILAIHLARDEPGACSLVVCPASCRVQWARAIENTFKKGCGPRVLVLDDARIPASELLRLFGSNDIVIVSFNFVYQNLHSVQEYQERFRRFRDGNGRPPARPVAALVSEFWHMVDLPFKRVVLDECHILKRKDGATYKAIQSLQWRAVIMLSGTILSNHWTDVGNLITLLQGHSLTTREKFVRAVSFPPPKNRTAEPDIVSIQRLLLAFTVARSSSCLDLPGLKVMRAHFELNQTERNNVLEYAERFERVMFAIRNNKRTRSGPDDIKGALCLAVKAQLHAAHKILCEESIPQTPTTAVEIEEEPTDLVVQVIDDLNDDFPNTRNTWLERLNQYTMEQLLDSSRIKAIIKVVSYALRTWPGEKIIIFSNFLKFLDIIARVLKEYLGLDCLRFDGTMDQDQKNHVQESFKDDSNNLLLITSGAGASVSICNVHQS